MKVKSIYFVYHGSDGDSGYLAGIYETHGLAKKSIEMFYPYMSQEHPNASVYRDLVAGFDRLDRRTKWARIDERAMICD
mgnify:CR=1 FL=1